MREKRCFYQNTQNTLGEIVKMNKIDMKELKNKNDNNNTCRITKYEQLA